MIKKTLLVPLFALILFASSPVFAQNQATQLPSAGLTPESTFYFLDTFGESLREFFNFNPEGKARLQITFAAERVAEIKVILETKGVDAKGLEVAQAKLKANFERINAILADQKTDGQDVRSLAKELDDDFDGPKSALKEAFKAEERALEVREKELKAKIREARQTGNTTLVDSLVKELGEVKAQKELLKLKTEEQENSIEKEESRLEEELGDKEEAEKAIKEAEKEKQEILDEAAEDGATISTEAFEKFNRLLAQAKELLGRENYQGATQLAKQAEKSLEAVEDATEDLEDAKEQEEELKEQRKEKTSEESSKELEQMKKEVESIDEGDSNIED